MRALTAGEKQKLFEGHAFFGVPDDVDALLVHARSARYSAGGIIFARGSPGRSMMAVLSGSVRISTTSPQGREVVLAILRAGEIFGEMALLDGGDRAADAIAMSDCELLVVDQRDFIPFLKNRSDVCIALLRLLSRRLRRTDELVEAAMFERLESRLAKALIQLSSTESDEASPSVQLKVSQRDLSLGVGASRQNAA